MATAAPEPRAQVTPVQVLGVVAGLIVLLGVLWFVFLRGGGEEPAPPVTQPSPTQAPPEKEPEPEETKEPGRGPVETFEVFAPKDPFDPLVVAATGGTAGGAGTGGTSGGGTGDGGDGNGGGGGRGGESIGGHRVRLIDTFVEDGRDRAQVQVDGTIFTVDEGEVFADNFQLLEVSGNCATLLFGDDQFTLCEGEEILK